jgi:hypothetical protein
MPCLESWLKKHVHSGKWEDFENLFYASERSQKNKERKTPKKK